MSDTISREQWIERFAARIVEKSDFTKEQAIAVAESNLEGFNEDLSEDPEHAADDELSYCGD